MDESQNAFNRFNGFPEQTVSTVWEIAVPFITSMKRGVNAR
jgi:hypothetical protein